jgi:hypothetical protein
MAIKNSPALFCDVTNASIQINTGGVSKLTAKTLDNLVKTQAFPEGWSLVQTEAGEVTFSPEVTQEIGGFLQSKYGKNPFEVTEEVDAELDIDAADLDEDADY